MKINLSVLALTLIAHSQVALSGPPAQGCTWEYSDEIPANVYLAPANHMAEDGSGIYTNGVSEVSSFLKHSAVLRMASLDPAAPPAIRHIKLDLSNPVPGSGSIARGVQSTGMTFKAFYYKDSNNQIRTIHSIPVGSTVLSDRTEIEFSIAGKQHYLTMGPWARGLCEKVSAINGAGTTRVEITRLGLEHFRIVAVQGSIARVWNTGGKNPVNLGLYYFSMDVDFLAQ